MKGRVFGQRIGLQHTEVRVRSTVQYSVVTVHNSSLEQKWGKDEAEERKDSASIMNCNAYLIPLTRRMPSGFISTALGQITGDLSLIIIGTRCAGDRPHYCPVGA